MKCDDVFSRLYAYTDGELSTRELSEIREHIAECDACAKRVREQETLQDKFRASLLEPVDCPDLAGVVMSRLPLPARRGMSRQWVWSLAAAACAAMAIAACLSLRMPAGRTGQKLVSAPPPKIATTAPVANPTRKDLVRPKANRPGRRSVALVARKPSRSKRRGIHQPSYPVRTRDYPSVAETNGAAEAAPRLRVVVTELPSQPGTRRVKYTIMARIPQSIYRVTVLPKPLEYAETIERPPLVAERVSIPML